ncbi:MAG: hypothetical protein CUN55_08495 [Phototrophicales bacterium]|nr:MAG: hypothetical protein CUN55_08495 [Phototrophicales bacterium]
MSDFGMANSENLLSIYTDALLRGQTDLQSFLQEHNITFDSTLGRLVRLADYLYTMLPYVKPSPEFVESLYEELVGIEVSDSKDWFSQFQFERQLERQLERFRHLPRPMQLAAGLTITAGFFWIASRVRREGLLSGTNDQDNLEKSA